MGFNIGNIVRYKDAADLYILYSESDFVIKGKYTLIDVDGFRFWANPDDIEVVDNRFNVVQAMDYLLEMRNSGITKMEVYSE